MRAVSKGSTSTFIGSMILLKSGLVGYCQYHLVWNVFHFLIPHELLHVHLYLKSLPKMKMKILAWRVPCEHPSALAVLWTPDHLKRQWKVVDQLHFLNRTTRSNDKRNTCSRNFVSSTTCLAACVRMFIASVLVFASSCTILSSRNFIFFLSSVLSSSRAAYLRSNWRWTATNCSSRCWRDLEWQNVYVNCMKINYSSLLHASTKNSLKFFLHAEKW